MLGDETCDISHPRVPWSARCLIFRHSQVNLMAKHFSMSFICWVMKPVTFGIIVSRSARCPIFSWSCSQVNLKAQ
jgi:hypothetical protein